MALGLLEAVLVSFVPAAAIVVILVVLALVLSSVVYGDWRSTRQALTLALGSTLVAAVICLPWVIGVLSAGRGAVAVFGVPNEEFGEEVKAVVQPLDWDEAGTELADELIDLCRSRLAGYKCPRSLDFVRDLPRDPNGKLYKRRLRDTYWAGHTTRLL